MGKVIREEIGDIGNTFNRLRRRDFSGIGGQVVKNSTYNLSTSLIAKAGSLLFIVIIVRMLGAELFGLYSLALSTILLFATFSDLGVSATMLTFVSKSLGEKKLGKAKVYFKGLLRYKIYLTLFCSFGLVTVGYILVNYFFKDSPPIYYALLAGALYIPVVSIANYINAAFQAENNFKVGIIKEAIFQFLRFTLIPLGIFFLLRNSKENSIIITAIIIILVLCYSAALLYIEWRAKKQLLFLKEKSRRLTRLEKYELKKFILPLTFTAISGMFFGFIDTFMLGHYVDPIYIGYYGAAFSLIGGAGAIIGFMSASVLPVFSRLKGEALENIFKKTRNFTLLIGSAAALFTFFMAPFIILIFRKEFLPATIILQLFSLMLIISPLSGIYNSYFTSIKRTKTMAKLIVLSTIINIILNIWFIKYGLEFSMMHGVIGACIATICSRVFYLIGVIYLKRKMI